MKYFVTAFIFILLCYSCTKDNQNAAIEQPANCFYRQFSYSQDIKSIISTNCSGPTCHSGGNGNYDFSTYQVVADRIKQGRFLYPMLLPYGDPQRMPQNTDMSACDLYKIQCWIQQGYPDN